MKKGDVVRATGDNNKLMPTGEVLATQGSFILVKKRYGRRAWQRWFLRSQCELRERIPEPDPRRASRPSSVTLWTG